MPSRDTLKEFLKQIPQTMLRRKDWIRQEMTRDVVFLLQVGVKRPTTDCYADHEDQIADGDYESFRPCEACRIDYSQTEGVFLSRDEGERYLKTYAHRYIGSFPRVYGVPATGDLATILSSLGLAVQRAIAEDHEV